VDNALVQLLAGKAFTERLGHQVHEVEGALTIRDRPASLHFEPVHLPLKPDPGNAHRGGHQEKARD
jgi:hypothetical protein